MLKVHALSPAAVALFRLHVERRGDVDVNDANRELARAGLMVAGNSFARGVESVYTVTREGFERKAELLACARRKRGDMNSSGCPQWVSRYR
jgi:hypothetical protein